MVNCIDISKMHLARRTRVLYSVQIFGITHERALVFDYLPTLPENVLHIHTFPVSSTTSLRAF